MKKILLILLGLILITGCDYVGDKVQLFAVTDVCDFIFNPDDTNSPYTKTVQTPSFKCEQDYCTVSGSVEVDKALGQTVVQCTSCVTPKTYSTIDQCKTNPNSVPGGESVRCIVGNCVSQRCEEVSTSYYEAYYNFCPTENFPYCTGATNKITSSGIFFTSDYIASRNQITSFTPKNADNTDITKRYIRVAEYDCSCLPAVEDGIACGAGQKYCLQCPEGYTFSSRIYCSKLDGRNSYQYQNNICHDSGNCLSSVSKTYKNCDSTQTIGQSTCNDWGTTGTCPAGQQCYVDATGSLGNGVGGCRCATDPCTLGERQKVSDTIYQECVAIETCLGWSSDIYCPGDGGLIFDDTTKECICNPSSSCNAQESECISSTQIKKCEAKNVGGKSCYVWGDATDCAGEFKCNTKISSLKDDVCDCTGVNECSLGQISCIDSTNYKECSKDPNNVNSCLKLRNLGGVVENDEECKNDQIVTLPGCAYTNPPCPGDKQCVNNVCVCKTTGEYCSVGSQKTCIGDFSYNMCEASGSCYKWSQYPCTNGTKCSGGECYSYGCTFNTPGFECDTDNFEVCVNNQCVCKDDENTCYEVDYLSQETRCNGAVIENCVKHGKCYRWDDVQDCGLSNEICVSG